ncbi:hypothetical protein Taro_030948 [Colocasia esculenta]|uniref:Uncharacterized protein n=1 Tax=Colocasia esculenta TaxID=4460 RepID=A0A843VHM9_COLES|nr:hypothetical protein [Colocasia esculenta]
MVDVRHPGTNIRWSALGTWLPAVDVSVRRLTSVVWRSAPSGRSPTSGTRRARRLVPDGWRPASQRPSFDARWSTLVVGDRCPVTDDRCSATDGSCPISEDRHPTVDARHPASSGRRLLSGGGRLSFGARPLVDSGEETYYDVLGAKEDASHDEIRAHYKAALLNSHPDKVSTKQKFEQAHERFLKIQKAWEVLGDTVSKGIYDRELKIGRSELLVVADEVELEEMNLNGSIGAVELVYPCRCGDNFYITSDELEEMGILLLGEQGLEILEANVAPVSITVPCSSCSLKISLTIKGSS